MVCVCVYINACSVEVGQHLCGVNSLFPHLYRLWDCTELVSLHLKVPLEVTSAIVYCIGWVRRCQCTPLDLPLRETLKQLIQVFFFLSYLECEKSEHAFTRLKAVRQGSLVTTTIIIIIPSEFISSLGYQNQSMSHKWNHFSSQSSHANKGDVNHICFISLADVLSCIWPICLA